MQSQSFLLILTSVFLTSGAQVLLKVGASTPQVRAALQSGSFFGSAVALAMAPSIIVGIFCFATAAVIWIIALSQADLSFAYPFISLGVVITVASGYLFFGETVSNVRLCGVALVMAGVVLVALSE